MTVPPGVAAFIAAETFFLLFCYLLDSSPTVLTTGCLTSECYGRLGCRVTIDIVPSAERLHRVQRYAKRPGNLTIAVSGHSEFYNLRFLIIGHIISAPSEGIGIMVSPSLTTEKFNPHRYGIKKAACRLSEEIPTDCKKDITAKKSDFIGLFCCIVRDFQLQNRRCILPVSSVLEIRTPENQLYTFPLF